MRSEEQIRGVSLSEVEESLQSENIKATLCGNLYNLAEYLREAKDQTQIFQYIQKLFLTNDAFDKCAVFFLRKLVYNFMNDENRKNFEIESLPIHLAALVEVDSYQEYLDRIVLEFGRDAQGILINLLPILLRISICVVNIDSENKHITNQKYSLQEGIAQNKSIKFDIQRSNLNLYDKKIYVLRQDNHYRSLYSQFQSNSASLFQAEFIEEALKKEDKDFCQKLVHDQNEDSDESDESMKQTVSYQNRTGIASEAQIFLSNQTMARVISQNQPSSSQRDLEQSQKTELTETNISNRTRIKPIQLSKKESNDYLDKDLQMEDEDIREEHLRNDKDVSIRLQNSLSISHKIGRKQPFNYSQNQMKSLDKSETEIEAPEEEESKEEVQPEQYILDQESYFLMCCHSEEKTARIKEHVEREYSNRTSQFTEEDLINGDRIRIGCLSCNKPMLISDVQHFLKVEKSFFQNALKTSMEKSLDKSEREAQQKQYQADLYGEKRINLKCCNRNLLLNTLYYEITEQNGQLKSTKSFFKDKEGFLHIPQCFSCGENIKQSDLLYLVSDRIDQSKFSELYHQTLIKIKEQEGKPASVQKQDQNQIDLWCCNFETLQKFQNQEISKEQYENFAIYQNIKGLQNQILQDTANLQSLTLFYENGGYRFTTPICRACQCRMSQTDLFTLFPILEEILRNEEIKMHQDYLKRKREFNKVKKEKEKQKQREEELQQKIYQEKFKQQQFTNFLQEVVVRCQGCQKLDTAGQIRNNILKQFAKQQGKILFFIQGREGSLKFFIPECFCQEVYSKAKLASLFPEIREQIVLNYERVSIYDCKSVKKNSILFQELGGKMYQKVEPIDLIKRVYSHNLEVCSKNCKNGASYKEGMQLDCGCFLHVNCLLVLIQNGNNHCAQGNCQYTTQKRRFCRFKEEFYEKLWIKIKNSREFKDRI